MADPTAALFRVSVQTFNLGFLYNTLQSLNCRVGFSEDLSVRTLWAVGCMHALAQISGRKLAQSEGLTYFFPQMTYLSIENNVFCSPARKE